jgi:hypothetical protein
MLPSLGVFSAAGSFSCLCLLFGLSARFMLLGSLLQVRGFLFFFFVCPPEGGLGSSWLKHALKERSPTTLIGIVGVVVVLVLERAFVVGGFIFC